MNNIVGLKELRQNLEQYVHLVEQGKSILVVRRSKPLFRMAPVEEEEWEEVIDFTTIKRGGVSIKELLSRL